MTANMVTVEIRNARHNCSAIAPTQWGSIDGAPSQQATASSAQQKTAKYVPGASFCRPISVSAYFTPFHSKLSGAVERNATL